jgi:hypothetical protein
VIFDIGGVILLEAGEGLETKWERRLGLREEEFIERDQTMFEGIDDCLATAGKLKLAGIVLLPLATG